MFPVRNEAWNFTFILIDHEPEDSRFFRVARNLNVEEMNGTLLADTDLCECLLLDTKHGTSHLFLIAREPEDF